MLAIVREGRTGMGAGDLRFCDPQMCNWIAPDFDDTPQDVIDSFYEGENDDEFFGPMASGDGAAADAP